MAERSDRLAGEANRPSARAREALAHRWLLLAAAALATSGLLAFGVVAARIPFIARHLTDPEIARRVLVVHVDLGVLVWFGAVPVALFHLAVAPEARRASRAAAAAPWLAAIGAVLMLGGLVPGTGRALTVNYVPVVARPSFAAGLVLFALALVASYLGRGLVPRRRTESAEAHAPADPLAATLWGKRSFLRTGGLYTLLAGVALALALLRLPPRDGGAAWSEALMWGPGHVLQLATVASVMVAWALLAASGTGRPLADRRGSRWAWAALALPLPAVLFLLLHDPAGWRYRSGFVLLMQWGLFPSLLVFLGVVVLPHLRAHRRERIPTATAALRPLAASALLMVVGLAYGTLIRGSDLRIPGHYHATIGSVTLAFMAVVLLLLPRSAAAPAAARARDRALSRVALLYGTGQLLFATGLVVAGTFGLGRKTYGIEQQLTSSGQRAGIALMAVGGSLALAGGLTWAWAVFFRLRTGSGAEAPPPGEHERDPRALR